MSQRPYFDGAYESYLRMALARSVFQRDNCTLGELVRIRVPQASRIAELEVENADLRRAIAALGSKTATDGWDWT